MLTTEPLSKDGTARKVEANDCDSGWDGEVYPSSTHHSPAAPSASTSALAILLARPAESSSVDIAINFLPPLASFRPVF